MKSIFVTKPAVPGFKKLEKKYKEIFSTGFITNSKYVRQFEDRIKSFIGVKYAVAVSSCTSGLILTLKSLRLNGEVILPGYTFTATSHAVLWCGLKPVFVDADPVTCNIDPRLVEKAVNRKTCAILAVHIWGNPCNIDELLKIAKKYKLKLIFDAAQAFGAKYKNKSVGAFGDAEVFSLSPTKTVTSAEGGIVATNNKYIAEMVRAGRNYGMGRTGDCRHNYDCALIGLNARMSEFHAVLGIESLKMVKDNIRKRKEIVELYKKELSGLEGIRFQENKSFLCPNYVYFTIMVDPEKSGTTRDILYEALWKEKIETKKYYFPPLHRQREYLKLFPELKKLYLPVTENLARNSLTLPLYPELNKKDVKRICGIVTRIMQFKLKIVKKCIFEK